MYLKKLIMVLIISIFCAPAFAGETQLEKSTNVIREIMQTPDKGIPQDLLDKSVCVGIVPSELKFALVVGGTYGRGVLVCRQGGNGPWGAPSFFTLGAGSVGFQIGGKATDVVFLVMNPEGAKKLVQDSVKLGAEVSATAGPVGRSAEGATDVQLHAEILSYSRTRGLFAGLSLDGAVLKQDKEDNELLYHRAISARDILINGEMAVPPSAQPLDNTLAKYSPKGGLAFSRV